MGWQRLLFVIAFNSMLFALQCEASVFKKYQIINSESEEMHNVERSNFLRRGAGGPYSRPFTLKRPPQDNSTSTRVYGNPKKLSIKYGDNPKFERDAERILYTGYRKNSLLKILSTLLRSEKNKKEAKRPRYEEEHDVESKESERILNTGFEDYNVLRIMNSESEEDDAGLSNFVRRGAYGPYSRPFTLKRPRDNSASTRVYGNPKKLSIKYEENRDSEKPEHILNIEKYNVLKNVLDDWSKPNQKKKKIKERLRPIVVIIPMQDEKVTKDGSEIFDRYPSNNGIFTRKFNVNHHYKAENQKRDNLYNTAEDSVGSAEESYEKNQGNPFTVHNGKYKQNWPWNFNMDGNHMNINPFGPKFEGTVPDAGDIMHARKWWFYNQDDYLPFRR